MDVLFMLRKDQHASRRTLTITKISFVRKQMKTHKYTGMFWYHQPTYKQLYEYTVPNQLDTNLPAEYIFDALYAAFQYAQGLPKEIRESVDKSVNVIAPSAQHLYDTIWMIATEANKLPEAAEWVKGHGNLFKRFSPEKYLTLLTCQMM